MPSEMENQFLIFSQHSSSTGFVYKLNKVGVFLLIQRDQSCLWNTCTCSAALVEKIDWTIVSFKLASDCWYYEWIDAIGKWLIKDTKNLIKINIWCNISMELYCFKGTEWPMQLQCYCLVHRRQIFKHKDKYSWIFEVFQWGIWKVSYSENALMTLIVARAVGSLSTALSRS